MGERAGAYERDAGRDWICATKGLDAFLRYARPTKICILVIRAGHWLARPTRWKGR